MLVRHESCHGKRCHPAVAVDAGVLHVGRSLSPGEGWAKTRTNSQTWARLATRDTLDLPRAHRYLVEVDIRGTCVAACWRGVV